MIDSTELEVSDRSQVSSVRRAASDILRQRGFGENDLASAELIVTELATNLVKHAQHGAIIVTAAEGTAPFADIVAIDRGPGIRDVNAALRDGYSTAGSPGTGLGAVQRRASLFDVYSRAEQGTIVYARLVRDAEVGRRPARRLIEYAAISLPYRDEPVCGDGWAVRETEDESVLMLVDGLGHGPVANEAARAAFDGFVSSTRTAPLALIEELHDRLRPTRGAAIAVVRLDHARGSAVVCGIGNISVAITAGGTTRQAISMHGIAGHQVRQLREFVYDWPEGATIVMHSDGLTTRWHFDDYPGLLARAPGIIAAVLWRDHNRQSDDVTVLAATRR